MAINSNNIINMKIIANNINNSNNMCVLILIIIY